MSAFMIWVAIIHLACLGVVVELIRRAPLRRQDYAPADDRGPARSSPGASARESGAAVQGELDPAA